VKTILSLLALLFLVSCAQPPPAFEPVGVSSGTEQVATTTGTPPPGEPAVGTVQTAPQTKAPASPTPLAQADTPSPAAPSAAAVAPPGANIADPNAPVVPATTTNTAQATPPYSAGPRVPVRVAPATNAPATTPNVGAATAPPGPGIVAPGPDATAPGPAPGPGALAPGAPGTVNPLLGTAGATNAMPEEGVVPAGTIDFRGADLNTVFEIYARLVNRTILRPATLPAAQIWLKTQTPLTVREAVQALDTVLGMNGITMIVISDKFVKAATGPTAFQEAAPFSRLDATHLPEFGAYVTHVVQLKYARPSEMVQVLTPFAKIPNSVMPIDSSQILVLRDYTENVKRMLELIKEIDVAIPAEFKSEVIPIKYALASEIANALNALSSGGGGAAIGGSNTRPQGTQRAGGGGMRGGTTGYPGAYPGQTQPYGAQAGVSGIGGVGGTAPGTAGSFSDRLRNIIQRASVTGDIQVLGQTKIIADERTNSLLIFASEADLKMIKDIVSKLDVVLAQVLIESVIMEVSLDNSQNVGISYLQRNPTQIGDFNGIGALKNTSSFLTPGNFLLNGATNAAGSLASGFSYLGRIGDDLDITVQAIAARNRINVLSRPTIQTSHAVPAQLFIGNTVPYIQGTTFGDYGTYGSRSLYQEKRVGITLNVLPLINPDGLVVMDIEQIIQQLGTPVTIDGNPVPTTTERTASAKVAVKDRDTIILGGFIATTKSKTKSGIPYLKDIPMLGYLFRSTGDAEQRVELIVMMRPTVLPTPEAAALAAKSERSNLPGIRSAEAEFTAEETKRVKKARKEPLPEYPVFEPMPAPQTAPETAPQE
jgi:general secretion pathway protein D